MIYLEQADSQTMIPPQPESFSSSQNSDHLLTPFQRKLLQKSLQDDLSKHYYQRIQIMLLADEGKSQSEICQTVGCSVPMARHWMMIARLGQAHNWQQQPPGRPQKVNREYLERLKELVSNSPKDYDYPFQRWTANWLSKHLAQEFGIQVSDRHINRLLKQMGLSTRPQPPSTPDSLMIDDLNFAKTTSESSDLWLFNSIS
jgi:transposase